MSRARRAGRAGWALAGLLAMVGGVAGCQRQRGIDAGAVDPGADVRTAQRLSLEAQEAEQDGKPQKAVELYRRAVAAYRDFPAAWNNLGVLLVAQGQHKDAFEAFSTAAELVPTDPRPAASMGMIWQELGYPDEAVKAYGKSLERDPNYLPALRESVRLETDLDRITRPTADRVRRALLRETDAAWRSELERLKIVIDQRLDAQRPDSGAASGS